jgi:RNA polymerase sigma-70 factor (ECF subfamily)
LNIISDQELIKKVLSGEDAQYGQLVKRYQKAVYSIAKRYLRNHDDADEVAQETFLRAYFSLKTYNSRYRFYTWLLRITINLCHDALKKQQRYVPLDENKESDAMNDPLEQTVQNDSCTRIRSEIDELPKEQREVILLRVNSDLSYEEIGNILNIPQGTVMSRLFRGRKALAERLEDII